MDIGKWQNNKKNMKENRHYYLMSKNTVSLEKLELENRITCTLSEADTICKGIHIKYWIKLVHCLYEFIYAF